MPLAVAKNVNKVRIIVYVRKMANFIFAICLAIFAKGHVGRLRVLVRLVTFEELRRIAWTLEGINALIQVTKEAGASAALHNASRQFAFFDGLFAQGALLYYVRLFVEVANTIGASCHTRHATNAQLGVDANNAVFELHRSTCRAYVNARSILAVLAGQRKEVHS